MRCKTPKLRQLEKNRFSVFYELDKCMNCGSTYQMTIHEIFEGKNRRNSMIYGFTLPLCLKCHRLLQEDKEFNDIWKKKAQTYFEKDHTRDEFINIFRRNYKD